jgi:Ser/Thr protein kinase RdoA (MazF antagonist)
MSIQPGLVNAIAQHYEIPPLHSVTPVTAGFLSQNYVLHTGTGRYFLKQYRFAERRQVAAAHEAKFFFAAAGVPVILPLRAKDGDSYFALGERFYSLFPYVEGRHLPRGHFSARALDSMAETLAAIHRAGRHVHLPSTRISHAQKDGALFVATARQILEKIPQHERTAFDELAEGFIRLKLRLAAQHQEALAAIDLASDHLVHGDYQDANLFFDAHEQVSHVFDWEKTAVAPRGLELVRAIEFICFSNPNDYSALFSEENFARARRFLQAYHQIYPMTRAEFATVSHVRYLQKLCSLWVESDHYLAGARRVDLFLEAEYNAVKYYAHHLDEHIERLSIALP